MATLENSAESIPCRHCGSPVRPGMVRCRECGNLLSEVDNDFVLSPQIAVPAQPKCAHCGMPLEPGIDDCPSCASALLDDLLKGPAEDTEPSVQLPASPAVKKADDRPQPRRSQPPQKPAGPAKSKAPTKGRSNMEDDPPGLFDDDDAPTTPPVAQPSRTAPATKSVAEEKASPAGAAVETSAACAALLASLATADARLRIEIVTALGQLDDKAALGPLEPHLVDQDIRVRRAVAAALVQLGHPKGETLLDIAERKPAAHVLSNPKASTAPRPAPRRSGGGMSIDGGTVKKLLVAVVVIVAVSGGVWYWMNKPSSGSPRRSRKPKSSATKKVSAVSKPAPTQQAFLGVFRG